VGENPFPAVPGVLAFQQVLTIYLRRQCPSLRLSVELGQVRVLAGGLEQTGAQMNFPKMSSENAKVLYMVLSALSCGTAVTFLLLRLPELASLVTYSAMGGFLVTLGCLAMLSLFLSPSQTIGYMLRRFALITLVLVQIKQNLDHDVKLNLKFKNLQDHVSIVTGANSGTGLAIAKQLVGLGSTVIITCRSTTRCQTAFTEIGALYPQKKVRRALSYLPL
jgi:multidrug transporter EmrE-like cation transporter